jgi:hypothetical protein
MMPKVPVSSDPEDILRLIKEWEAKWEKQKKEEIAVLYDKVVEVCARYSSSTVITALELVKAQVIRSKLETE